VTQDRCFVAADWQAVESWLTALFSGDPVLTSELREQLRGGVKLHSRNAALLYGCDPADAKTHMINLKGTMRQAYDGGKRLSHAFNYGMGEIQMSRTFWLSREFARDAIAKLSGKYAGVVAWREALANRVFGIAQFVCPRGCGYVDSDDADCPTCTAAVGVPIPLRFGGYAQEPARVERTAFDRIRHYPGRRREGRNALASQHPQSCGASMYNITLARLHGYDPLTDTRWPTPEGVLQYDPREPWTHLMRTTDVFVAMGIYDSFAMETPVERAADTLAWLLWTMEQPWAQLDGWRFPAEGFVGGNLGKWDERRNVAGLRENHDFAPLTVEPRGGWVGRFVDGRPCSADTTAARAG
jgi:hypothetical protein